MTGRVDLVSYGAGPIKTAEVDHGVAILRHAQSGEGQRCHKRDEGVLQYWMSHRFSSLHCPMPLKVTVCGLLFALSVMLRLPVKVPTAGGVKVAVKLQYFPAPNGETQVLVCAKFPTTLMELIV